MVIIGIIAAVAVPRLGRAGSGGGEAAFTGNLMLLRRAIDHYHAEHGAYPTAAPLNGNRTTVMFQLTQFTDAAGNYSAIKTGAYKFGPYLREIPQLTVSDKRGASKINTADAGGAGWIYDPATGHIQGNTGDATDEGGRLFSSY